MRPKRPYPVSPAEVKISRVGESAIIEYADEAVGSVNLRIGPEVHQLSDNAILALHHHIISAQTEMVLEAGNTVVEIPAGKPQIEYWEGSAQWVPRGEVVRCLISDNENGEPIFYVDDQKLSLREFGQMLLTFNGWGMRVAFVDEAFLDEEPTVQVRDRDENGR